VLGQLVGWSLAAALPLRALASLTDVVPCYDHAARRLYLVDAQPGGNGLAAWVYAHAEELLPLAYDVALACRNDPLLEPLSRADMDWLLALLGRAAEVDDRPPTADHRPPARSPAPVYDSPTASTPANEGRRGKDEGRRADQGGALGGAAAPGSAAPANEGRGSTGAGRRADQPPRAPPSAGDRAGDRNSTPSDERRYGQPQVARGAREQRSARREPDAERLHPKSAAADGRHDAPPASPSRATPSDPRQHQLPLSEGRPAPAPPARQPPPARTGRAAPPPADRSAERPPQPGQSTSRNADRANRQPEEAPPDPAALIARLRRQREQREARSAPPPRPRPQAGEPGEVEPRFVAGDRIFCLPYGDGVVRDSRIEDGRELLTVDFANHGDLTIDPAVNFVRKQEDVSEEDDSL
jgi:hypothetical protein